MTNPHTDIVEPREAMRAGSLPLQPPSPIATVEDMKREQLSPAVSPAIGDERIGSPSSIYRSDSETELTSAPSPSPDSILRNGRRGFNPQQLAFILSIFETSPYPSREQYRDMAAQLHVDIKSIKLWFQNRRCKARKAGTLQGDDPEAGSRSSSDDDDIADSVKSADGDEGQNDAKRAKRDDVTPLVSGPAQYKEMTCMALPPDHPFCQLLQAKPAASGGRRAARRTSLEPPTTSSTSGAPRVRRRGSKKATAGQQQLPQTVTQPLPVPGIVKPEAARLWRPIDEPTTTEKPPPTDVKKGTSSPLDLSVSLKRKRDGASTTGTNPATPPLTTTATVSAGMIDPGKYAVGMPAGYPMMFPGGFPFYGHPGGAAPFLAHPAVLPQMAFPMAPMPIGVYGHPGGMWGPSGMSVVPQAKKPVR